MGRVSDAKERLIETAQFLFLQSSYDATTVEKICARAKVNKGSFYYFFPSKHELLLTVIDKDWEFLKEVLYEPAFAVDLSPLQRIERLFQRLYTIQCDAMAKLGHIVGCPISNLGMEMAIQDEAVREKVETIFDEIQLYFERALQDAQHKGQLATNVDIQGLAEMLLAYFQGSLLVAKTGNSSHVILRLAQGAMRLVGQNAPPSGSSANDTSQPRP